MNRAPISTLLLIALVASLGMNVWLWRQLDETSHSETEFQDTQEEKQQFTNPLSALLSEDPLDATSPLMPAERNIETQSTDNSEALTTDTLFDLLRDEDWPQLTVALQNYLRQNPNDVTALMIEAELIARTQPLALALVNYYALLDQPLEFESQKRIEEKIQQLFENATEQLRFDRAWDLLAELIEPLVQIVPDERRYLILLAEAYAQQANEVMMENALAGLPFDDPAIESIRQILQRQLGGEPDTAQPDLYETASQPSEYGNITQIPLDRLGNQYTLEIGLDSRPIRLMIDTGASTTAVTTRAWSRLSSRVSSRFIGVFKVNTAAGFIEAPMFSIKSVTMGPLQFDDVSVMVIPSRMMGDDPARSPQGLLGMNILSQYNFQIDQQNATLLLRPLK